MDSVENMKKTYVAPSMETIDAVYQGILCDSTPTIDVEIEENQTP